jgi:HAD superfamily hydrolase (TIGR01509 family)
MGAHNIQYVIFDLSEVLIHGVVRFEAGIAREIGVTDDQTSAAAFGGPHLHALLEGSIGEDRYLAEVIAKNAWTIAPERLKALIRQNFNATLPGTIEIARQLSRSYRLALLSDHAREWAAYIVDTHDFLDGLFVCKLFSYEIGCTKREPRTFHVLLDKLSAAPDQCLFVDDNPRNVEVARSVGIDSIRFLDAGQLRGELLARGIGVEHGR